MAFSPLSRLDDWLIDHLFQPICDWIRNNIGWSKKIPAALFLTTSAASLIPYILWCIEMRRVTMFPILLIINAYHAAKLFEKELAGSEEERGMISIHRLKYGWIRKLMIVTLLISIPLIVFLALKADPFPLHLLSVLLWSATETCSHYFLACTDLPKPLKRRVLAFSS